MSQTKTASAASLSTNLAKGHYNRRSTAKDLLDGSALTWGSYAIISASLSMHEKPAASDYGAAERGALAQLGLVCPFVGLSTVYAKCLLYSERP